MSRRSPPPLLVTGFEPFGGEPVNPSWQVAQTLHGRRIGGAPIVGVQLALEVTLRTATHLRQSGGTLD